MPRANRYLLPRYIWYIVIFAYPWVHDIRISMFKTHRCHNKEFSLKFSRGRERWIVWLFEARKRYGLCVLG